VVANARTSPFASVAVLASAPEIAPRLLADAAVPARRGFAALPRRVASGLGAVVGHVVGQVEPASVNDQVPETAVVLLAVDLVGLGKVWDAAEEEWRREIERAGDKEGDMRSRELETKKAT